MRGVQIDVRLDEIVLRALEKEPGRRYQNAGEVKTMVETIATTAPPPPAEPSQPVPAAQGASTEEPRRFSRTAVLASVSGLIGLTIVFDSLGKNSGLQI